MCTSLLHTCSELGRAVWCQEGRKVGLPTIDGNISNSQKARRGHQRRLGTVPVIAAWLIEGPSELVFCPLPLSGRGRN